MDEYKYDVSIVIVCMNNLKMLYPCLDSIKKYTSCSYEVLVTTFLFSKENLEKLSKDYSWVKIVESNEYRGFSENNNLALRQAKGRYCFVLNDDTYHNQPVIDNLVKTFDGLDKEIAVLSPVTLSRDGSVQRCGKPKYTIFTYFIELIGQIKKYDAHSKYTNKDGVFQTYNISGAAFMIRTSVFEEMGWFDEKYYFCPEDIALSTKLNQKGYKCYVNTRTKLTHIGGGTWSKTIVATKPATVKGFQYFYRDESIFSWVIYSFFATFEYGLKAIYWILRNLLSSDEHKLVMIKANWHAVKAIYSWDSPKQIFIKYYTHLKNGK